METDDKIEKWYEENGEAIGLFYAAFIVICVTLALYSAYIFSNRQFLTMLISVIFGLMAGIGCGIFTHALIVFKRK